MLKIDEILYDRKMTRKEFSQKSNIPYSCIEDICNLKSNINNISFGNALKIAKTLDIKVEDVSLLQDQCDFNIFKSNIQHEIKEKTYLKFIVETLQADRIQNMFKYNNKQEALYLLACIDYLSRINEIPLYEKLNKYRSYKSSKVIYPRDLLMEDEKTKKEALKKSIPEFKNFNIVEVDFLNVI